MKKVEYFAATEKAKEKLKKNNDPFIKKKDADCPDCKVIAKPFVGGKTGTAVINS
jgi:hypothetical protein